MVEYKPMSPDYQPTRAEYDGEIKEMAWAAEQEVAKRERAIAWAIDRLSVDFRLSLEEQAETARQLSQVLRGEGCHASDYCPPSWSTGGALLKAKQGE